MRFPKTKRQKNQSSSKGVQAVNQLKEWYKSLSSSKKEAFIDELVEDTGRNSSTVYSWIRGATKPSKAEQMIISNKTGLDIKTLFN